MKKDPDDCSEPICMDSPLGNIRRNLYSMKKKHECPLDRQQLGIYSWSIIHTFAIYYPEAPTVDDKVVMKNWLDGFKHMYPCSHCRGHFQKDYQRDPPNLENRQELSLWACRQHNYTNKILGKDEYPCNYEYLQKRWKKGCNHQEL